MITITALIIVTDRLSYLKENINSLIKFNSDIFVVSNGYNKEIFNFLDATKKTYPKFDFKIIQEQVHKCRARNIGIESVNSDVIYFLDDDTFMEQDNIKILQEKFNLYPVGVIGGSNLTPKNSSRFQKLVGFMLSTPLMSYKMCNRYLSTGTDRFTDDTELILCNLAIKKELFSKYNLKFNELLHYNEENLLLEQIKKHGVRMLYSPNLNIYHHRRADIKSFLIQVYNSGKGRGIMSVIMPSSIKIFYFLPMLFVVYLILLILQIMPLIFLNLYLIIVLYNVICVYFINKLKLLDISIMFLISGLSHICYGVGLFIGLIQGITYKKTNSPSL